MNHYDREIAKATIAANEAEQKEKLTEAEPLAMEAVRTTGLLQKGPKDYDYIRAAADGHSLEETEEGGVNLPNRYHPSGVLGMQGIDIAKGRNVINPGDSEIEKRGAKELSEGYINTERGAPPTTIVPLAKLAYAHAMRGGTLEDFRAEAPESYKNLIEQAWSIGHGAAATYGFSQLVKNNDLVPDGEPAKLLELPEMTTEELRNSPEFLNAARIVLTSIGGEEFEGDDDQLFEAAVNEMANFNWDPVTTSRRALRILNGSYPPEVAKAYGMMMQYYQATGTDWDIFKKSLWHGVTSPANLIGIATIGGAIVGKTGQKAVQQMIMKHIQSKILQAAIVPGAIAASEGAMYGALDAKARKFIMDEGGWDVSEMPSPWQGALIGAGVGTFFGGTFGAALSRPARQEFMQFIQRMEQNWKDMTYYHSGTPQAQRGSLSFKDIETQGANDYYPDQGLNVYDSAGEGYSRLFETAADSKVGIIGKKPVPASELKQRIETLLHAKGGARFSADEVRDTRLMEWLDAAKDEPITKDELLDYLYANRNRVNIVDTQTNPEGTGPMFTGGTTPERRLERAYADAIGDKVSPITVVESTHPDHLRVKTYAERWAPKLRQANVLDKLEAEQIAKGEMDPSMRNHHEVSVQTELELKHPTLLAFQDANAEKFYTDYLDNLEDYIAGRADEMPELPEMQAKTYEWTNPRTGEKAVGYKESLIRDKRAKWVMREFGNPKHTDMLAYLRQNDETMLKAGPTFKDHTLFPDPRSEAKEAAIMFADDMYLNDVPENVADIEYRELRFFLPFREDSVQEIAQKRFGKLVTELTDDEMARTKKIQGWMKQRQPQGDARFEDVGVKSHFLGDINRMAHARIQKVWDDAGDEVVFINELQSDMRNYARAHARGEGMPGLHDASEIAVEKQRRKAAYESGKFFDSAEEAALVMTINRMLKQGQTRFALPANMDQLVHIQQWEPYVANSQIGKTMLRKYTKDFPKMLKKRWGDKVTIETKTVHGQPGSAYGEQVTVITIDPSVADKKLNLNGFIAAPGVATMTMQEEDNHRHAQRDSKGRFIKDKK